jgi:hypothetical protein
MTESIKTPYIKRCEILSDFWIKYSSEDSLEDFFEYNDLGVVLAFAIHEGIVESTNMAEAYVNETFDLLLAALKITDIGFVDVDEMFQPEE